MATKYKGEIENYIKSNPIFVASKTYCPYCKATKDTLDQEGFPYKVIELNTMQDGDELQEALYDLTGQRTVPNIFINGKHIGGNSDLQALKSSKKLHSLLQEAAKI